MRSLDSAGEPASINTRPSVTVLSDPAERHPSPDRALFWPERDGVSVMAARFVRHRFRPHTHDTLMIGLIEAGTKGFARERASHVAGPGTISVVNPGEMHTGERLAGPELRYRALYVPLGILSIASDKAGQATSEMSFAAGTIDDPATHAALMLAHDAIASGEGRLARECLLLDAVAGLIHRHAVRPVTLPRPLPIPRAVRRAQDILHSRFSEELPIGEIAAATGLSAFHLMHAFRRAMGLPIHAYQIQLRVEAAKRLLDSGLAPADVALEVGFADQSHLTRRFKDLVGTSPGRYQRAMLTA
ncbi:AraC family transcriptional regulator [Methylobacterium terrae]|nr:AraC family transcriptional regulator [Methylobacterium terrae]